MAGGRGARRQVREALAAKHVIRVCSAAEGDRVAAAARRLLESAALIQQSVDLSGARMRTRERVHPSSGLTQWGSPHAHV